MNERIIQFGTGNFLRGFADYFVDKLNKENLYDGKIVIASPTDSKTVDVLNEQNCCIFEELKTAEKFVNGQK